MSCLVQLADGTWIRGSKRVKRITNATIFPHPSAAKAALSNNAGSKLVPFAEVADEWRAAFLSGDIGETPALRDG